MMKEVSASGSVGCGQMQFSWDLEEDQPPWGSPSPSHQAYLILMCQVRGIGFCAFAIEVHPSLSSYATVAASCGMSRSHRMLQTKRHMQPTSQAAMNSASVEDRVTVD
jgi:hypothetical protein